MKQLRIHVPQHFTVNFCPCGVHDFYRDAILRHQRTQYCYVGHLYEVNADSYSEFRDLILPHVTSTDRRQVLLLNFPPTKPTVESDSDTDVQTNEPTTLPPDEIATRPLRILVSHTGRTVEENPQPLTTTTSPVPSNRRKKRRKAQDTTVSENTDDVQKLQKRAAVELNKLQTWLKKRL